MVNRFKAAIVLAAFLRIAGSVERSRIRWTYLIAA
jgi:hypothetical protein